MFWYQQVKQILGGSVMEQLSAAITPPDPASILYALKKLRWELQEAEYFKFVRFPAADTLWIDINSDAQLM